MKLTILYRNLRTESLFDTHIENRLIELAGRVRIDDAHVLVEHRSEASPAFRVELHLAVPGPDLRSEYNDNTPQQAFTRAMEDIERTLRQRQLKRLDRLRAGAVRTLAPRTRTARGVR